MFFSFGCRVRWVGCQKGRASFTGFFWLGGGLVHGPEGSFHYRCGPLCSCESDGVPGSSIFPCTHRRTLVHPNLPSHYSHQLMQRNCMLQGSRFSFETVGVGPTPQQLQLFFVSRLSPDAAHGVCLHACVSTFSAQLSCQSSAGCGCSGFSPFSAAIPFDPERFM